MCDDDFVTVGGEGDIREARLMEAVGDPLLGVNEEKLLECGACDPGTVQGQAAGFQVAGDCPGDDQAGMGFSIVREHVQTGLLPGVWASLDEELPMGGSCGANGLSEPVP